MTDDKLKYSTESSIDHRQFRTKFKTRQKHPDTLRLDFLEAEARKDGMLDTNLDFRGYLDKLMKDQYAKSKKNARTS